MARAPLGCLRQGINAPPADDDEQPAFAAEAPHPGDLCEQRFALLIVLVPQYLPEEPVERCIREAVLDRAGLPYLLVSIPPQWRSPTHYHPTPAGAAALAKAVSAAMAQTVPAPAQVR